MRCSSATTAPRAARRRATSASTWPLDEVVHTSTRLDATITARPMAMPRATGRPWMAMVMTASLPFPNLSLISASSASMASCSRSPSVSICTTLPMPAASIITPMMLLALMRRSPRLIHAGEHGGQLGELGRGAGVQAQLVADGDCAVMVHRGWRLLISGRRRPPDAAGAAGLAQRARAASGSWR
jgi:hypothetical protein